MKNQYVGDVGDYGKYGLLRFLAERGIKIGVNWYLSENDKIIIDGNINNYLDDKSQEGEMRYDGELFELLKPFKDRNDKTVEQLEELNIIPGAIYFHEMLDTVFDVSRKDRHAKRDDWHKKAMKVLDSAKLIFADPDNGSAEQKKVYRKNGEKYAGLKELADYYHSDKDVVYYCHKGRRKEYAWQEKMVELKALCPDAQIIVLTFHRGTQRSYIFAIHTEQYEKYDKLLNEFLETDWGTFSVKGKQPPFSRESLTVED